MEGVIEKGGLGGPAEERWIPWTAAAPTDSHTIRTLESKALAIAKEKITMYYEQGQWDDYKKITNPYEYIFLSWNRRTSRSVSTRSPLSRSYFKMIEFWKYANLTEELGPFIVREGGLRTAHSAEGPGGFLEAISVCAEKNKWVYTSCHAMTLRSTTKHVPGWRKASAFLETHPNIHISYGIDDTGDILNKANRTHFIHECGKVHLYTADGGFDFSGDYNGQEDSIFSLLVAEFLIGIQTLAKGGVMIIKCFDTTEKQTLDLMWMACSLFREWKFIKPRTSRAGNAERYFVGIGFLGEEAGAKEMIDLVESMAPYKKSVPLLQNTYPNKWLQIVWDVQETIEKEEYRIIRDTIALICEETTNSTQLRALIRQNVQRSIDWCKEHDEPISGDWVTHLDRYVAQEVIDLLQILRPAAPIISVHRIPSWTVRPDRIPSDRMFETFRSEEWTQVPSSLLRIEEPITSLRAELPPDLASHSDPPERFPRGQRRYADLFSRPRRTPTVEASSLISLQGKTL